MLPKKKKQNKKQIHKIHFVIPQEAVNITAYTKTLIVHIRDNCKMNVDIFKIFQL